MRTLLLLLSLVLACLHMPAQLAVRNLSTEHGLPSDNVYCVFSDRDGFLWFGTDNGLARFDGKNFKNYTSADGLADNEIFGVYQSKDGRLWLRTYSGKACYIADGKVYTSANDSSIQNLDFSNYVFSIESYKDTLFFASSGGELGRYHGGKSWRKSYPAMSMLLPTGNGLYTVSNRLVRHFDSGQDLANYTTGSRAATRTVMLNGRFYLTSDNELWDFKIGDAGGPRVITSFGARLQFIANETDSTVFLGSETGAFRFNPSTMKIDTLLSKYAVSYISRDFEGGLWICTLGKGVFYFGNSQSILLGLASPGNPHREFLFARNPTDGQWFCIGQDGDITFLKGDKTASVVNESRQTPWGRVRCVIWLSADSLFLSAERLGAMYEPKSRRFSTQDPWMIAKEMHPLGTDSALVSAGGSYYSLKMGEFKELVLGLSESTFANSQGKLRVNCAMELGTTTYAGSNAGLYRLNGIHWTKIDSANALLDDRINAMTLGENGTLWVGMANRGIVLLKNDKATLLSNDFRVVNVRKMRSDDKGNLWACNHEGVFKFSPGPSGIYQKTSFTPAFGYPLANAWDILPLKDNTYVATDQGLIRFEAFSNNHPPRLIVEEVQYGEEQIIRPAGAPLQMERPGKRLIVRYAGISYGNYGQLSYHYRIPQINDQWKTTTSTEIAFLDMRPGDYVLELKAVGNSGLGSKTYFLQFSISPYFYQTAWFLACCLIVLVAIVILIIRSRVRRIQMIHEREQEKSKKEIERIEAELYVRELEQKAMRLQMNPHFIFNALNTIQGLYANKDIPKAKEYISKLSTLIRQILEQSSYTTISLGKELELVSGYLNVTLYRFENLFKYEIDVEQGINLESIAVPPLILQPIVENSVIHGIAPKGSNGQISIQVGREMQSIVIRVKDNGVGLTRSQMIKDSITGKTTSKGMKLTQERLQHIWEQGPGSLLIEEMKDQQGQVTGTMVTIRLAEKIHL